MNALRPKTPIPPASPSNPGKILLRTVLVADGNATTASLTRTIARVALGREASYVSVATGPEALMAVIANRPDLVISEFMLKGSDGVETLKKIREQLGTRVPAVFTVQKIEQEYVRQRLPPRAAMVVRPFDRATLEAAIRSAVES
ncbi:MAG: response regulator [Polyangiaceae bacterium]